jgi:hypothetical protein
VIVVDSSDEVSEEGWRPLPIYVNNGIRKYVYNVRVY